MRIANIADVHFGPGKTFEDVSRCWEWAFADMAVRSVDVVNVAGDLFDKPVIGASALSTGEIYAAAMKPVEQFISCPQLASLGMGREVNIIPGNHDYGLPGQAHAAMPMKSIPGVNIINSPTRMGHIAFLPWLSKAWFLANAGLSESDPDEAFRARLSAILRGLAVSKKDKDKSSLSPIILIGHAQVMNAWLNASTQCAGGDMLLDPSDLGLFNYVALGDFHRRQKYYVGALCQHNFGEEGNLSGYELLSVNPGELIQVEWVECPVAPHYRTIDTHTIHDLNAVEDAGQYDHYKLRIHPDFGGDLDALRGLAESGVVIERVAERSEMLRTSETLQDESRDNPVTVLGFWARHNGVTDETLAALKTELTEITERM